MNAIVGRIARAILPRSWRRWLRQTFGWRWFRGSYATWAEAREVTAGYDDAKILQRTVVAARAVRQGEASWERDGQLFAEPAVNEPLLDVLRQIASKEARLDVVDVGGALGSTWWQHRAALAGIPTRWRVVEQPALVATGRAEFSDEILSFHDTLAEAAADGGGQTVLLSGVLPYVEAPHALLDEVIAHRFENVIMDRTPFVDSGPDRLAIQHTPPALGGGTYPCWLFERDRLLRRLFDAYELVSEWAGLDDLDPRVAHRGLWFRKKVGP